MNDDSPSSFVPRSVFYDVEAPSSCSPRKKAAAGAAATGDATTTSRDATLDASAPPTTTAALKKVSFARHVQVSDASSTSSSSSASSRTRRTRGEKPKRDASEDSEDGNGTGQLRVAISVVVLIAACVLVAGALFAAGWSARGYSGSRGIKLSFSEDPTWQAAPPYGENSVLGSGPSRGFLLPGAKQGIHDQRYWDARGLSAALAASVLSSASSPSSSSASHLFPDPSISDLPASARERYASYDLIAPGVKRYNVWWAGHEVFYPPPRGINNDDDGDDAPSSPSAPAPSRRASSSPSAPSPAPSRRASSDVSIASTSSSSSPSSEEKRKNNGCPRGSFLWPSSERHRRAVNASRFHCYDSKADAVLQGYLALDAFHGIQSYATVWKAPAGARHPGCAGFDNGGGGGSNKTNSSNREFGGCSPTWSPRAMADFGDFVAYLADRHRNSGGGYRGGGADARQQEISKSTPPPSAPATSAIGTGGGFSGFIIWNEAASAFWFDTSPLIAPASGPLTRAEQAERWADAYGWMLETAERALRNAAARPALVLASFDTLWGCPLGEKGAAASAPISPSNSSSTFTLGCLHSGRAHLGSGNLVDALWDRLGARVDWSLAVHPYSSPFNPDTRSDSKRNDDSSTSSSLLPPLPSVLHFSDLRLLSERQAERAARSPTPIGGVVFGAGKGSRAPQAVVAATEQGWNALGTKSSSAAVSICEAHSTVVPDNGNKRSDDDSGVVGVAFETHNDFQSPSGTNDDPTGLVPFSAGPALRSLAPGASPTLSALESTRVGVWGQTSGHFCCAVVGLGCARDVSSALEAAAAALPA